MPLEQPVARRKFAGAQPNRMVPPGQTRSIRLRRRLPGELKRENETASENPFETPSAVDGGSASINVTSSGSRKDLVSQDEREYVLVREVTVGMARPPAAS